MNVKCSFINRLRNPKIFGMAIFDWIATFVTAMIIAVIFKRPKLTLPVFMGLTVLAIVVHIVFKVPTMLNYYLGLNSLEAIKRPSC